MLQALARLWKCLSPKDPGSHRRLDLGWKVADGNVVQTKISLSERQRAEHLAILGKSGTGKSSLLRWLAVQDVKAGRGFIFFDLHGDATPFLLRTIARAEVQQNQDLSSRLIVIDPSDPHWSVGFNVLELRGSTAYAFVQIAEFAELLKRRWSLDSLGARTEEALRNSLLLLAENGFTLLELAPLLVNPRFRAYCVEHSKNEETRRYFETRYDALSEAMRTAIREPLMNKVSFLSADPHFRHLIGQRTATFSLREAMDRGYWIVVNLRKGRLGEEAVTLGSLFLSMIKNALFSREHRQLFTLYCDEMQNLVAYDSGLETVLSEARKFGVSVISANQFLDQLSPKVRAAVLSVGTQICFQLTGLDAQHIGNAFGGGRPLMDLLRSLPKRHMIVKMGVQPLQEACAPQIDEPRASYTDLYDRSQARYARRRTEVEREIAERQIQFSSDHANLKDWE